MYIINTFIKEVQMLKSKNFFFLKTSTCKRRRLKLDRDDFNSLQRKQRLEYYLKPVYSIDSSCFNHESF